MHIFTFLDDGLFFIIFDVTDGKYNVFTLIFFFHSIVTPQCVVLIEKSKSNEHTYTLLDHGLFLV